jgi:hypothetical protein
MSFTGWLSGRLGLSASHSGRLRNPARRRAARPRFRPTLEALEDRWLPSTLTVTTTADSGPGSLRAEIAAAHNGDTIVFAPSLDGQTITLTSGELFIKHNLTIAGPGAGELTVSGNNASRVFEVAKPATATLSGLTISNGSAIDGGGILVDSGATLTLSNSTLSGNSASQGGAINNNFGTVTVISSTLTGNSATLGGAIMNLGTLTVSASLLSNNSALYGGGIYNTSTATLNAAATTLSNNTADSNLGTGYGGGIDAASGTVTLSGCTLSGNSAAYGGGISIGGSTATVTVTVSGCTLTGNAAGYSGGGIWLDGNYATVTVENSSTITGNSAPAGQGADVYNYGVVYLDSTSKVGVLNGNPATPI